VANRGAKRDFFDIAFLLEEHPLGTLLSWYERKFPGFQTFHVIRSLIWFEDAENDPEPRVLKTMTWSGVKKRLANAVAKH
jgi:hypothetical protein